MSVQFLTICQFNHESRESVFHQFAHKSTLVSKWLPHIAQAVVSPELTTAIRDLKVLSSRVQWFWLFSHFEVKQPIPDTLRAQGFGNLQKKIFNFIHGLGKVLAKTRKCVFWYHFKVWFYEHRFMNIYHFSSKFHVWDP